MARLILIILLFLTSLLTVVDAPAYYLWILAIGATEFPLIFGGIALAIIISGFWVRKFKLAGTIIGIISIALFLLANNKSLFRGRGDQARDDRGPWHKNFPGPIAI
jgi:hypothetical protein